MKALTLVYLLAAATAASTYGTVVAAAANNLCPTGNITSSTIILVDGSNVANKCGLSAAVEDMELTFANTLTTRSSFSLTGKPNTYYGTVALIQHSSFPVDITVDSALIGTFSLEGTGLVPGSTITLTNCQLDGNVNINVNATRSSILIANNAFDGVDFNINFYRYVGDLTTVTVRDNTFYNADVYIDFDSPYAPSMTFRGNTLHKSDFEHYTAYNSACKVVITENLFDTLLLELYNKGSYLQFAKNRMNVTSLDLESYWSAGTTLFDDNTVTCAAAGGTTKLWDVDFSGFVNRSVASVSRNTFAAGCERTNEVRVTLPSEFPAASAVYLDGNRYTIVTALVNHIFFEVTGSYLTAPDGPATFSLSGNDFRFADGITPADLTNSPLVSFDVSVAGPLSRGMHQQGGTNDLKLQMSDNVVDGKVLSTPEQLGAFFGGFTYLYNNFEGTFSSNPTQHSAAPATASIASAAAAMAACVAVMLFA